jgi:polyisoprenoid-binding protein YceI
MPILSAIVLAGGLALPLGAQAQVATPIPSGHVKSGSLSFDGHASVGDFVGTTSTVSGQMTGGDSLPAVRGWVEAPVVTLKTGNGKRDRDLNKSMESDKYPTIRFDLASVTPGAPASDSVPVTLRGKMVIHGVSREVDLPGFAQFHCGAVRVRSDFPLNLKDYEIGGLTKMLGMLKMYENIEVHVDLTFAPT